jgi:hypothetical protein
METVSSRTQDSSRQSVSDGAEHPVPAFVSEGPVRVELYMFRVRKSGLSSLLRSQRTLLFLSRSALESCASADGNRVRKFIRRMMRSRTGVVRWFGRMSRSVHRYYQTLEDRIDPLERMVKALNAPEALEVRYASDSNHESQFRDCLRFQVIKHAVWMVVDAGVTGFAILLMPIPGPNILGWYPFLRVLSHYRALKGARRVLRGLPTMFREWPELAGLDAQARAGKEPAVEETSLKLEGLDKFLNRVG